MARATPDPLRCSAGPILFPVFEPPPDNLEDDIEEDEEVTFNVEDDIPVVFPNANEILPVLQTLDPRQDSALKVISFGLRHTSLGRRDRDIAAQDLVGLRSMLWQLWEDQAQQFEDLVAFMAHPQPLAELDEERALVLLVQIPFEGGPRGKRATLLMRCNDAGKAEGAPFTKYVDRNTDAEALKRLFPGQHLCTPHGFRPCLLTYAGIRLDANAGVVSRHGALCRFQIGDIPLRFARASSWHSNFENMAQLIRDEHVGGGQASFRLWLHRFDRAAEAIEFTYEDIVDPEEVKRRVEANHGQAAFKLHLLETAELYVFHDRFCGDYHCLLERLNTGEVVVMMITQTEDENHGVHPIGYSVVSGHSLHDIYSLHCQLCLTHRISSEGEYFYSNENRMLRSLEGSVSGDVIMHTVRPIHLENESSEEDVEEDDPAL